MSKKTGVVLSAVMGVSLVLGACSNNNNGGEASPSASGAAPSASQGSSAPAASPELKEQTFTFLNYSNPSWPYDENWKIYDFIKEKTGVTLDVQLPAGNLLEDALSLTIASGDMPDLMWTQSKAVADKFGQQGALVNILDYVDKMPNFKAWMEKYPTETQNVLSSDGKMYVFPNEGLGESNRRTWMYREDVFKKLGLSTPNTWDELYDTLTKLKAEYPDSYPLTFRNGLRYFYDFGAGFNVPAPVEATKPSVYLDSASGEWKYAAVQDEFKTMLTYFNKFYKDGLIPKDFLTIDTKMWQDIVSTDRAFITLDYIGRIDFYNSALRKDNPEFTMAFMAPPAGWAGGPQKNAFTATMEEGFMISSKTKKVDDIVKFIDFFYSEEGRDLVSWGKEGDTASGKSYLEKYADITDLRKKTGLSTDGTYTWYDFDTHISVSSPELQDAYKQAPQYDGEKQASLAFTPEEQQILSTKGDSLNGHRDENFAKFIIGTRSFDEWDKFVEEQKKLGYEEILGIYKTADERAKAAVK
ncbi:extracellular solute-binding protein [Cohnella thailandensis]|uniref:Extracellular solute-binding protein n=1 Tax=Cohnella thailandensis TaxID=557557 RepID=A0A841SWK2_9BACL|nr:extracellular solute-binding protein [Cohnella thailandensis]MBB6635006.1 extracellular solute-binding protein [Cohnella thailandensis]MBP1975770.1 putative aldouronate transport system substrate-binding protein [Cohnella thailandensis]